MRTKHTDDTLAMLVVLHFDIVFLLLLSLLYEWGKCVDSYLQLSVRPGTLLWFVLDHSMSVCVCVRLALYGVGVVVHRSMNGSCCMIYIVLSSWYSPCYFSSSNFIVYGCLVNCLF